MLLLILAAYVVGWLLAIRPTLRRWMLTEVCPACRVGNNCRAQYSNGPHSHDLKARGAISDRDGRDAAGAIGCAAWWPIRLVFIAVAFVVRGAGRGIRSAVLSGQLTGPEMERRLREQQAEIDRLSAQIDTKG